MGVGVGVAGECPAGLRTRVAPPRPRRGHRQPQCPCSQPSRWPTAHAEWAPCSAARGGVLPPPLPATRNPSPQPLLRLRRRAEKGFSPRAGTGRGPAGKGRARKLRPDFPRGRGRAGGGAGLLFRASRPVWGGRALETTSPHSGSSSNVRLMTLMVKPVISDVGAARARSATTFLESAWRQVAAGDAHVPRDLIAGAEGGREGKAVGGRRPWMRSEADGGERGGRLPGPWSPPVRARRAQARVAPGNVWPWGSLPPRWLPGLGGPAGLALEDAASSACSRAPREGVQCLRGSLPVTGQRLSRPPPSGSVPPGPASGGGPSRPEPPQLLPLARGGGPARRVPGHSPPSQRCLVGLLTGLWEGGSPSS